MDSVLNIMDNLLIGQKILFDKNNNYHSNPELTEEGLIVATFIHNGDFRVVILIENGMFRKKNIENIKLISTSSIKKLNREQLLDIEK